jgi:hypothetical protein
MPLIIEDGTSVEGANSYITVDELRTFALDRGVAFPAAPSSGVDPAIAIFTPYLIRATDYLQSRAYEYAGYPSFPGLQALAFPRVSYVCGQQVPLIPLALKNAQAQLVLEQMNGIVLMPSQAALGTGVIPDGVSGAVTIADGRFKTVDKLDVLEDQFSETVGVIMNPIMPAVEAFLRPILYDNGGKFFTTVRL